MVKIKICGITQPDDAGAASDLGADYIGLNFYRESPRHVSIETARKITASLNRSTKRVGVFVNSPIEGIVKVMAEVKLDAVQLHGDEEDALLYDLKRFADVEIIRAVRIGKDRVGAIKAPHSDLTLLDAYSPEAFGGTGSTFDWSIIQKGDIPLDRIILAGGLNPENVADAVRTVRPFAVDVASGVESSPGTKDPAKMKAFIEHARSA